MIVVTGMCIWGSIVFAQHAHNHLKTTCKDGDEYFWWDRSGQKSLKCFLLGGSKNGISEYLVSLPQVENAQNLYPNFTFTIVIVFTVVQVSIRYRDSW